MTQDAGWDVRVTRGARVLIVWCVSLLLLVGSSGVSAVADGPDGGDRWYVAMGDSLAAGFQAGEGDDKTGGYAGGVLWGLQQQEPRTRLKNFGCTGEDTTSIRSGSLCSYPQGSQLAAATAFLRAHRGDIALITIDLGFNDLRTCLTGSSVDPSCFEPAMRDMGHRLTGVLQQVRKAAPSARIVVLNYYNPFLAWWLTGDSGQRLARQSAALQDALNTQIGRAARQVGAPVADVARAFDSADFDTKVSTTGHGRVPRNVARVCAWTRMCHLQDLHASDAGYAVMAQTVLDTLPGEAPRVPRPTGTAAAPHTAAPRSPSSSASSTGGPPTAADAAPARDMQHPDDGDGLLWGVGVAGGLIVVIAGGALLWRRR